jgi:hypothetical protein
MTSLLRQIVAGPRAKHDETGLDLCYVTEDIIATYVFYAPFVCPDACIPHTARLYLSRSLGP